MNGRKWILTLLMTLCITGIGFHTRVYADSGISIPEEQIVLMPAGKTELSIIEVIVLQNAASKSQDITLPLPTGFKALSVKANGKKGTVRNGQVFLPEFVPPHGTNQVSLVYRIPFTTGGSIQTSFHNPYPVDTLHLYEPIGNMEISAPDLLAATQTAMVGHTRFRIFTRQGILKGQDFTVNIGVAPTVSDSPKVSGLPQIGEDSTGNPNTWQAVGNLLLAGFILLLGFVGGRFAKSGKRDGME